MWDRDIRRRAGSNGNRKALKPLIFPNFDELIMGVLGVLSKLICFKLERFFNFPNRSVPPADEKDGMRRVLRLGRVATAGPAMDVDVVRMG